MQTRDFFNIGAAVMAALAVTPAVAFAMDSKAAVDAAKAAGLVGEQADGFLGFVKPSSDPALKAAVDDINSGRAALYREAAAKNGVTPPRPAPRPIPPWSRAASSPASSSSPPGALDAEVADQAGARAPAACAFRSRRRRVRMCSV